MANTAIDQQQSIADMDDELLPVPRHRLHGPGHFLGLYGAEHVAATEFVIGAAKNHTMPSSSSMPIQLFPKTFYRS